MTKNAKLQKSCRSEDRPRPMSRKTSEVGVKKLSCLSDEGASLDGFSQLSVSFSSEAGAVLTFLLTFCVKTIGAKRKSPTPKQINSPEAKSKSGFRTEAPTKQY